MSGSRSWTVAPRSYGAALGVAVSAMALRIALNPVLGARLPYFLQVLAVLISAWYFGFVPSLAGLFVMSLYAVYRAIAGGRDTAQFWSALAMLWILCLVVTWLLVRVLVRHTALEQRVLGSPVVLVNQGHVVPGRLRRERVTEAELEEACREHGVSSPADCRLVVLEVDGSLSVVTRHAGDAGSDGNFPPTPA